MIRSFPWISWEMRQTTPWGLFKQRRGGSIKGRQYHSVVGAFGEIKKDFKKVVKFLTWEAAFG